MPVSKPIQIFPNDIRPNVGIGVDIPFNKPGVFTQNFQTKDAVKNNLINFFLTNPGERFMNPNFGGGLRDFIFEQISNNSTAEIKERVQDILNVYFTRIDVDELDILTNPDNNTLTIFMRYSIKNSNLVDSITIDFNQ